MDIIKIDKESLETHLRKLNTEKEIKHYEKEIEIYKDKIKRL